MDLRSKQLCFLIYLSNGYIMPSRILREFRLSAAGTNGSLDVYVGLYLLP